MLVPSAFAPTIYDVRNADDAQLAIKAKPGVELAALQSELSQQLRACGNVRPGQDDDFSVNRMDMLTGILDTIFSNLALGGGFIAMFAILVGCFSIANIMFVSVRERTKIIGVQKAIGAKNATSSSSFCSRQWPFACLGPSGLGGHPVPGVGCQRHGRGLASTCVQTRVARLGHRGGFRIGRGLGPGTDGLEDATCGGHADPLTDSEVERQPTRTEYGNRVVLWRRPGHGCLPRQWSLASGSAT